MSDNRLSQQLLEILVCPIDNEPLIYVASENVLFNPRLKKSYEIKNSIPVMLEQEALDVSEALSEKYLANATCHTGPTPNQ